MNLRLFRSWHGGVALAIVLAFVAWMLAADLPAGRAPGYDRSYLLATGWASLALFLAVLLHVTRKYVHKLGVSPEFRMRAPIRDLELAETELNNIRRQVVGGTLTERGDVLRAAKTALRRHGVQRILRIELEAGAGPGDPAWSVLALPTFPLGRMFHWMHAHLYYGLAAGVLVLLHGGGAVEVGLSGVLTILSIVVVASGLAGIGSWASGPARMTAEEHDLSAEKAFALRENLARKVEAAYESLDPALAAEVLELEGARRDFDERARELLSRHAGSEGLADALALLGQRRRVGATLAKLMRRRARMHAWRVFHIPVAIVLAAAIVVHVATVLWY